MSSRIPYWQHALSDPKGIQTAQKIASAKLVLDKSITDALDPAASFMIAAILLVALLATMRIFHRSIIMQKHPPGVKVVLLLSVLAYWAVFGLTIFGWRFG
jgi:hypothetical protein